MRPRGEVLEQLALYLSSGVTNWNFSNDTFPAPAPVAALPIESEFIAPRENDDSSNCLVFVAWFWIVVSPTGVSLPKSFVGASNMVMPLRSLMTPGHSLPARRPRGAGCPLWPLRSLRTGLALRALLVPGDLLLAAGTAHVVSDSGVEYAQASNRHRGGVALIRQDAPCVSGAGRTDLPHGDRGSGAQRSDGWHQHLQRRAETSPAASRRVRRPACDLTAHPNLLRFVGAPAAIQPTDLGGVKRASQVSDGDAAVRDPEVAELPLGRDSARRGDQVDEGLEVAFEPPRGDEHE